MQKSHKTAAYTEQIRTHAPTGSTYGLEKGNHPNRKVDYDSLKQKWAAGGTISAEEEATPAGWKLRRDLYGYD